MVMFLLLHHSNIRVNTKINYDTKIEAKQIPVYTTKSIAV